PNCLLMNISCESNLNHTDIVFYENAAGQEVGEDFEGPGAGCNVLTNENWFWRKVDTHAELKSVEWALDKIYSMNEHNVAFILNGSPNQLGLLDENMLKQYEAIGKSYQKKEKLMDLPKNWAYRKN
ncbi:MAG: alpha-L-fucosidase, partial [Vallitaleaceae bacterium]|nr:alpha-L-fucosidase [Vallitaleaceae bacterium]